MIRVCIDGNRLIESGTDRIAVDGVQLTVTVATDGSGKKELVDKAGSKHYLCAAAPLPGSWHALSTCCLER